MVIFLVLDQQSIIITDAEVYGGCIGQVDYEIFMSYVL